MKNKSERTLEDYKTAGAYLRLFKYVYHLGWDYLQPVMPKVLWNWWHKIGDKILCHIQCELENRLFQEHGDEEHPGENFIRVFYGEIGMAVLPDEAEYNERALAITRKEIVERFGFIREE